MSSKVGRFAEGSVRVAALVNPRARRGSFLPRWAEVRARVERSLGLPAGGLEVHYTTPESPGAEQVRSALQAGVRKIISVGGDGTLSQVVQGFFEAGAGAPIAPEAELAVFPAGRGNDFFRRLRGAESGIDLADAEAEAFRLLLAGEARPHDLLRFEFHDEARCVDSRYSVNLASFGLSGAVVGNVLDPRHFLNRSRLAGSSLVYAAHTALELRRFRRQRIRVMALAAKDQAHHWEGEITEGAVLNSRFNAGGAQWLRRADPEDGRFELVLLAPETHLQLLRLVPRLVSGDWDGASGAKVLTGLREVEICREAADAASGPWIEVDGELLEHTCVTRARVVMVPGVLRVWSRSR